MALEALSTARVTLLVPGTAKLLRVQSLRMRPHTWSKAEHFKSPNNSPQTGFARVISRRRQTTAKLIKRIMYGKDIGSF